MITQHTERLLSLSNAELEYVENLTAAGAPDVASVYVDMLSDYNRYSYSPVDTLFLGESITQGLPTQDMFSMRTVNRGIGGDTVEGLTARLERIAELKPKRVFLMIGINNSLPVNEVTGKALRKVVAMYPELAIRELATNTKIHQNFFFREPVR